MVFIVFLLLLAGAAELLSLKDRLKFVRHSLSAATALVEPLEAFELVLETENTGRLPLSYIEIEDKLPTELIIDPDALQNGFSLYGAENPELYGLRLQSSIYLLPRQKLERRVSVSLPKRGRYIFRGATLKSGDFLGFSEKVRYYDQLSEIVVIPAPAPNTPEITALGGFLGDISVRRFIMEDPVLTIGFRDYTGREPQKAISWKQSARLGRLSVKQYDHTLEPSVTVLLNVQSGEGEASHELVERCFSLARTVSEALEQKGIKYGFMTNATTAGAFGLWSTVPEGLGRAHLSAILEGLGRATYECTEGFESTAERAARMAENGRSHIIITPVEHEGLRFASKRLRDKTGGEVYIVSAQESGVVG